MTHVLFDFFGTLVDYAPGDAEEGFRKALKLLPGDSDFDVAQTLWNSAWETHEAEAQETLREYSMDNIAGSFLEQLTGGPPPEDLTHSFGECYMSEWSKGVRYLDGVDGMVERLSNCFHLAVITNTHNPSLVPNHLKWMGVADYFQLVVTSVEFGRRKPDQAIFEHTLDCLEAAPDACVYVGDTFEADYVGARRAGLRPFLIDPEKKHGVPPGDRLASILELEDVLKK